LIQQHLNTRVLGRSLEYFEKVNSTNTRAWELISAGSPNGTIVLTDQQTAGRGRGSHHWWSIRGKSLTFSVILKPDTSIHTTGWFSILTGVAIAEALGNLKITVGLKWPNDIVLEGKKLGGILCETRVRSQSLQAVVLGIGLNVNETAEDFKALDHSATTSLFILSEQTLSRERVLVEILNRLEQDLEHFYQSGSRKIRERWLERCSHLKQSVTLIQGSETLRGIFTGLGPQGEAQLEMNGKRACFNAGEIRSLTPG